MSKGHKNTNYPRFNNKPARSQPVSHSLLDLMVDGREYQSIVGKNVSIQLDVEMKRALEDIQAIRKRPIIIPIASMKPHRSFISNQNKMPLYILQNLALVFLAEV